MRRFFAPILAGLLLLGLGACGGDNEDKPTQPGATANQTAVSTATKQTSTTGSAATAKPPKDAPSVTIEGTTYYGGFYDTLHPMEIPYQDAPTYEKNGGIYYRIQDGRFDLMYNPSGSVIGSSGPIRAFEGVLYCAESQWGQAQAYYADEANYKYFYSAGLFGTEQENDAPAELFGVDPSKFAALMAFADKNEFDTFDRSRKVETRRLDWSIVITGLGVNLAKVSNDRFFTIGNSFFVVENRLALFYYYDGSTDETLVVDVPEELSAYFVTLLAGNE